MLHHPFSWVTTHFVYLIHSYLTYMQNYLIQFFSIKHIFHVNNIRSMFLQQGISNRKDRRLQCSSVGRIRTKGTDVRLRGTIGEWKANRSH